MAGAIIGGGIGALGSWAGGKAQADAMKHAADLQAKSTQQALDFTKQQYGDLQGRLNPYIASGRTANAAMAALLAQSPYYAQARRAIATPPRPVMQPVPVYTPPMVR